MGTSPAKRARLNRINQEFPGSNGAADALKSVASMETASLIPATTPQPSRRESSSTLHRTNNTAAQDRTMRASAFRSIPFSGDTVRATVTRELTRAEISERNPDTPEHVAEGKSFPLMDKGTGLPRVRTRNGTLPKGCRPVPGVAPAPETAAVEFREPRTDVPGVFETTEMPADPRALKHAPGKGAKHRNYKLYGVHDPSAPKGSIRSKSIEKTVPGKGMIPGAGFTPAGVRMVGPRGKTLAELPEKERTQIDQRHRDAAREAQARAEQRQAQTAADIRDHARAALRDALGRERIALAAGDAVAARAARADVSKFRKLSMTKGV